MNFQSILFIKDILLDLFKVHDGVHKTGSPKLNIKFKKKLIRFLFIQAHTKTKLLEDIN